MNPISVNPNIIPPRTISAVEHTEDVPKINTKSSDEPVKYVWSKMDQAITNNFTEKIFVSFESITFILHAAFGSSVSQDLGLFLETIEKKEVFALDMGLEVAERILLQEKTNPQQISTQKSTVSQYIEHILGASYFKGSLNIERWQHLLFALYLELAKIKGEEFLDTLIRIQMGSEEALTNFQHYLADTKQSWAKGRTIFGKTPQEIMDYFLNRLCNLYDNLAVDPIFERYNWHTVSEQSCEKHLISTTLIDLLLIRKLLEDRLPIGYIPFLLKFKEEDSNDKILKFDLSFFYVKRLIQQLSLEYTLKTNTLQIFENSTEIGTLKITKKESSVKIIGSIRSDKVELANEYKEKQSTSKWKMGNWKSDEVRNHQFLQEGTFVKPPLMNQKNIKSTESVRKNKDSYSVYKHVVLEEDSYHVNYLFKGKIPMPLFASGVIQNSLAES